MPNDMKIQRQTFKLSAVAELKQKNEWMRNYFDFEGFIHRLFGGTECKFKHCLNKLFAIHVKCS